MRHHFCASESTHDVVNISDKRGSKRPKKPQNSQFPLGIAERSDLRGGSMSPRLFLLQNRASLSARFVFVFVSLFRKSSEFCVIWLSWRTWSLLSSNRHTRLSWGLHGDIYGRRKEGVGIASSCRQSHVKPWYSHDECFYFRRQLIFYHPDLSLKLILPPRFLWKVGMPTNPYTIGVAGRCEVRRKRFTAPTLSPA